MGKKIRQKKKKKKKQSLKPEVQNIFPLAHVIIYSDLSLAISYCSFQGGASKFTLFWLHLLCHLYIAFPEFSISVQSTEDCYHQ